MKIAIKNLFATALTLVVLTSSAFASTTKPLANKVTVLSQVKNISKIVVSGNVEVLLLQAPVESVKVYDGYYTKNALVQQENGELRISSFEKETLTVAVYVRELSTIELGDNSTVKTYGKVNFLSLDVVLNGSAKADIDANTVNLTTTVKDNAKLALSGSTTDLQVGLTAQAKVNMDHFKAESTSVNSIAPVLAKTVKAKKLTLENIVLTDELAK
jgi:hypothetical protein